VRARRFKLLVMLILSALMTLLSAPPALAGMAWSG
jgi:hypothetical protein